MGEGAYQSPVTPSLSIGWLSVLLSELRRDPTSTWRKRTFASGNQVIDVSIICPVGEAQMRNGS